MRLEKKEDFTLIYLEETSLKDFTLNFSKNKYKIKYNHLILKLSDSINISKEEISLSLKLADFLKQKGFSFILISKNLDLDSVPEALIIVPTLLEAKDALEFENIERDLGF